MFISTVGDINRAIIILFIVYVVGAVMGVIRGWLFTLAGHRLVARLRKNLFKSIIRQDIAFFDVSRYVLFIVYNK